MEDVTKEVYFWEYCKTCKYQSTREDEDPCDECLQYGSNQNSHKPVNWTARS